MTHRFVSGDIIQVTSLSILSVVFDFIVQVISTKQFSRSKCGDHATRPYVVSLGRISNPYSRLTITQAGDVIYCESSKSSAPGSIFVIEEIMPSTDAREDAARVDAMMAGDTLRIRICCVNQKPHLSQGRYYLGASPDGDIVTYDLPSCEDQRVQWSMQVLTASNGKLQHSVIDRGMTSPPQRYLHHWQYHRFIMEGYLQVPNIIPTEALNKCLKYLNHAVGVPGNIIPGGLQQGLGVISGSITACDEVKGILTAKKQVSIMSRQTVKEFEGRCHNMEISALKIVEELFGAEGSCDLRQVNEHIAFRFPEYRLNGDMYIDTTGVWIVLLLLMCL